jgi:hypothetical protein
MMESGSLLFLKDSIFGVINYFIVEKVGFNSLSIARIENPYHRLHFENETIVFKSGPTGRNNILTLECVDSSLSLYRLGVLKTKEKDCKIFSYIGVSQTGSLSVGTKSNEDSISTTFHVIFKPYSNALVDPVAVFESSKLSSEYKFKQWQVRRFVNEGYIQLPRIVKKDKIDECVRYLNHHLGKPGDIVAGGVQGGEQLGKFTGHLSNCSAVKELLKGQVELVLNALFGGSSGYEGSNLSAQIAYRFPELTNPELREDNRDEIAESTGRHWTK